MEVRLDESVRAVDTRPMPVYVVTEPESIRGVYNTWDECTAVIEGVQGAKHQKVQDLKQAQAMVEGGGVVLSTGLHVFTDGNSRGGVGVVVVWMGDDPTADPAVVTEISASVGHVFYDGSIPGLDDAGMVSAALEKSRNILAELGGLYLALWQAPERASLSIVHDYEGVAKWMKDEWKIKDAVSEAVIGACKEIVEKKELELEFVWQKGHTSSYAGRHDLARFNGRADKLASAGASST